MSSNKKKEGLNVLSCFDGLGGTYLSLKDAGIPIKNYYSSEIDKFANKVTLNKIPGIIPVGDITELKVLGNKLIVTRSENDPLIPDHYFTDIDLVVGGSPCQGFSFAGKGLNFEDERSVLFWEFVRLVNELKPKYFLLENVMMKKEWQKIISDALGVEPIKINSSLVSAQNRIRLYWTNIPNVSAHIEDQKIKLADILEDGGIFNEVNCSVYYPKPIKKGIALGKDNKPLPDFNSMSSVWDENGKSPTLTINGGGNREPKVVCGAFRGRYLVDGKRQDHKTSTKGLTSQRLELRSDEKLGTLTTVQKDNVAVKLPELPEKSRTLKANYYKSSKANFEAIGKFRATGLQTSISEIDGEISWRKLTPIECERLQTVPDNWTECVSNTQRYKMLGNGFTIKVISHILKNILSDEENNLLNDYPSDNEIDTMSEVLSNGDRMVSKRHAFKSDKEINEYLKQTDINLENIYSFRGRF